LQTVILYIYISKCSILKLWNTQLDSSKIILWY
jgi:hypothetical protein